MLGAQAALWVVFVIKKSSAFFHANQLALGVVLISNRMTIRQGFDEQPPLWVTLIRGDERFFGVLVAKLLLFKQMTIGIVLIGGFDVIEADFFAQSTVRVVV